MPSLTAFARPQGNLQPSQAAQLLNDRVKRIAKVHLEIADWLQVRPHGPEPPFGPQSLNEKHRNGARSRNNTSKA